MSSRRRGPWSQREDELLMRLVQQQGASQWVKISETLNSRTPKQCRERYHQNLKPSLNHDPISAEEGVLIEKLVGELGKRWAEIARRLDNRSDNAVKNWYNGSMNRRKRTQKRRSSGAGYEDHHHHSDYTDDPMRPATVPPSSSSASSSSYYYDPVSPTTGRCPPPLWHAHHHSGLPSPSSTSPRADCFDGVPYRNSLYSTGHHTSTTTTTTSPPMMPMAMAAANHLTLPPLRRESFPDSSPTRWSGYGYDEIPPLRSSRHHHHHSHDHRQLPPIRVPPHHQDVARPQLPTAPNSPHELAFRPSSHHQQYAYPSYHERTTSQDEQSVRRRSRGCDLKSLIH